MSIASETLLAYAKNPPNKWPLPGATFSHTESNRSCGDSMIVHLRLDTGDTILEFSFEWDTAIITTAAAAIFGENIIGMNISEILRMKYVDIQTMLGQDVSPKRQLAACLALLATRNGIHLYLWDEIKDDFSDVLGE